MWISLHTLQEIQKLVTISMVQDMITYLNMFPSKSGIPSNLSTASIILRSMNPDYNKLKIIFGAYAQFYIGIINSINQIIVGEIALHP